MIHDQQDCLTQLIKKTKISYNTLELNEKVLIEKLKERFLINNQVWISTEVEVTADNEINSLSQAYASENTAIQAMNTTIVNKIRYNEEHGYPTISINWQDHEGAQLSTDDECYWVFKIESSQIA